MLGETIADCNKIYLCLVIVTLDDVRDIHFLNDSAALVGPGRFLASSSIHNLQDSLDE
jgi:hypothetical protein